MPLQLSIIVPAYNEAHRLPPFLLLARPYLDSVVANNYEIIVVDDGSHDGLDQVLSAQATLWPELQFIRYTLNQGKGAAIRRGMQASSGGLLLVCDADGACPIEAERG